ncbi:MAG: hypothetical protein K5839_03100, partial [Treponemataceae bacterium]|nr:hypothetical protein [Treponemataceae bacterium]
MNTISTTFDENLCDCTLLGGQTQLKNAKYPVSVLILNRNSSNFKENNLEVLIKCGFEAIYSIENSKDNFKVEGFSKRFPQVNFLLPAKKLSTGNLINLGMSLCKSKYLMVIWDDFALKFPLIQDILMAKIIEAKSICFAPVFVNNNYVPIPSKMTPRVDRYNFSVFPESVVYDNSKTLYPFDYCGVYDKDRFINVGGFDSSLTSAHWQLLDFSLRSWLWG